MARLVPWLLPLAALAAACIIPIPAEPQDQVGGPAGDAGDGFPAIMDPNPPMPGPVALVIGVESGNATVTVADSDIGQTLYVRVFRDYATNSSLGPISSQSVPNDPIHGTVARSPAVPIDENQWCSGASPGEQRVIDVVVADQEFDTSPSAPPIYRAVTNGGRSAIRSWLVRCLAP